MSIVNSDQTFDQAMIIVACEDLSVYMLNYRTSQYLFKTMYKVEQFFIYSDSDNLTIVMKLKDRIITNAIVFDVFEVPNLYRYILIQLFLIILLLLIVLDKRKSI